MAENKEEREQVPRPVLKEDEYQELRTRLEFYRHPGWQLWMARLKKHGEGLSLLALSHRDFDTREENRVRFCECDEIRGWPEHDLQQFETETERRRVAVAEEEDGEASSFASPNATTDEIGL